MCRGVSGLDVFSRAGVPAGRLRDLDVSTDVFAGLATYANLPYVHCLSTDPASVDKYDYGRLVRPFSYLRPQDKLVPCGHAVAVLDKVDISPYRCISHSGRYPTGNASTPLVRMSRMSAALLVASTRTNWIPMNAFDLDDLKAIQLRAPLPTDQIQSRNVVRVRALSMRISWAVATASRKHRLGAGVSSLDTMRTPARSS